MPFVTVGNTRMFYRLQGNAGRPVLVLSHSIGTDHSMWDLQVADLLPHFQVLRYDTRGHGASDAPAGEYSVEMLGGDILGLADALGISQFAFCGLSMGGAVGQWVAAHAPERVTHLVLANTSPQFVPRTNWEARIEAVLKDGMQAIVDVVMPRMFLPETLAKKNPHAASIRSVFLGTNPVGYTGCCAALRDMDHGDLLWKIKAPTLVIVGDHDISTPWSGHGERLVPGFQAQRRFIWPRHIFPILSGPDRLPQHCSNFFFLLMPSRTPCKPDSNCAAPCSATRTSINAIASTADFTREFQDLITRYAWGTIWSRPELDLRTRRLLVLAVTASLGRWEEFALHVRAGLASELELCDLKELLLQLAVYAGVPAANTGFKVAGEQMKKNE